MKDVLTLQGGESISRPPWPGSMAIHGPFVRSMDGRAHKVQLRQRIWSVSVIQMKTCLFSFFGTDDVVRIDWGSRHKRVGWTRVNEKEDTTHSSHVGTVETNFSSRPLVNLLSIGISTYHQVTKILRVKARVTQMGRNAVRHKERGIVRSDFRQTLVLNFRDSI